MERLGGVLEETATPCYAWALIPNHFHLLIRTGSVPVADVMRRLLTGYAVSFNSRHRRCGHLFQNRYKSILCQEERYLLERVRYIHLNPIKSDERVLGDSDFVDTVLKVAGEKLDRKYRLQAEGYGFDDVVSRVCEIYELSRRELLSWSKQRKRAIARSVLAYGSVRELGMSAREVAEKLALSPSAASRCVQRGERVIDRDGLVIEGS